MVSKKKIPRRLVIAPQFPAKLRYQEWWIKEFRTKFSNYFSQVEILGPVDSCFPFGECFGEYSVEFSPQKASIQWEAKMLEDYFYLRQDDILFLTDISYPGIFPALLFHGRPDYVFAFCHATSLNRYDIFSGIRKRKFAYEKQILEMCNGVFVGSEYHRNKLLEKGRVNTEIFVSGVPFPPSYVAGSRSKLTERQRNSDRSITIASLARPCMQKVTKRVEKRVQREIGCKIIRPNATTWNQYYDFISKCLIVLSTSKEETFGYQIIDAILGGAIPLAPNKFSYPEILPSSNLYDSVDELISKIKLVQRDPSQFRLRLEDLDVTSRCSSFYHFVSSTIGEFLKNGSK